MDQKGIKTEETTSQTEKKEKPQYESPKIVSYSSEELLEQIGPAMACSPSPCGIP